MKPEIKERLEKINRGQVPEVYKETKLGIIPSKWEIRTIGQLVEDGIIQKPMDGNHGALHPTSKDYVEKGIPFILATDLEGNKLSLSKCKHIKKEVADKLQKGFSVQGDVLLTHKGSVGNTAVVPKIETEYIMLTPQVTYYRVNDRDKLSNYYLYYHFQGETFQRQLKVMSKGATRDYIGIVAQNNLEIIFPTDIKEQQKIADILSTWDKAIELKEKLIEQKKEQKKGLMQRLLTGKVRLPGFKGEWKEVRLKQILEVRNEKSEITGDLELYSLTIEEGVTPKTDRYNREYLVKDDNKQYKITYKDDIVYNPSNLRFGAIAINKIQKPVLLSPIYEVLFIKDTSKYDVSFIAQLLTSDRQIRIFSTMAEGTLIERKAVKVDAFLNTAIYIPQDIKEQKAISKIIGCYVRGIELLQQELEALKQQKKGLMQLLLTGKVRVKC